MTLQEKFARSKIWFSLLGEWNALSLEVHKIGSLPWDKLNWRYWKNIWLLILEWMFKPLYLRHLANSNFWLGHLMSTSPFYSDFNSLFYLGHLWFFFVLLLRSAPYLKFYFCPLSLKLPEKIPLVKVLPGNACSNINFSMYSDWTNCSNLFKGGSYLKWFMFPTHNFFF